jgi:hypothetical protein
LTVLGGTVEPPLGRSRPDGRITMKGIVAALLLSAAALLALMAPAVAQ